MKPTNVKDPEYFHKVVDCQYACPAHTPVPEYIRLIAQQRYDDAYMVNWESNVFPGVLGRTCDRPCEPACRRGRVDEEPVAICRLKRVAADNKASIEHRLPDIPIKKNGKKIALIGAGPASLTVARDLMPLGYSIDIYDENPKAGGFMRSQIPSFRLPESVLDEEVGYILDMGVTQFFNRRVESLKEVLAADYDAVFIGTGAPQGKDLKRLANRQEADANIHIGINWLSSVAFEHIETIGKKVIIVGGGNTAMDCCRTAKRIGGEDVIVTVRSTYDDMKASPWEKEDAMAENIPFKPNHSPKEFVVKDGKLVGMTFEIVESHYDDSGKRTIKATGEEVFIEADDVLLAIGQETAFPWIETDCGVNFNQWGAPELTQDTFQSSNPKVFFGGDAALGPENIITAVAQGHQAAISIDLFLKGKDINDRLAPGTNLTSTKMGIHEWAYGSAVVDDDRYASKHLDVATALSSRMIESELGFDTNTGFKEAERCLNCDVQTVFSEDKCIECDGCTDICPTDCITFTTPSEEADLRTRLNAPADDTSQDLYVSDTLKTQRVLVKDENVCLHCGLCAERCPTSAWDMQKYFYGVTKAGQPPKVNALQGLEERLEEAS